MTTPPSLTIDAAVESWPIAGAFVIARGAKREATVVVARVSDGTITGRGECIPYARYGETVAGVRDAILGLRDTLRDRASLARQMPAGAARNALDCALWDYEAKRSGTSAAQLAGLTPLHPVTTAYTISLDTAEAMAAKAAAAARTMPLLKLKLGGAGDAARLRQVRAACPADAPHRRRQRGVDAGAVALAHGRRRRDRRRADRAAAARGRRCGARRLARRCRCAPMNRCTTAPASMPSPGATTRSTSSSTRPAGSPRRWRSRPRRAGAASRSWWAAWCRPRSPWRQPCCSRRAPTGSTSTDRCCWRATATPALRYEGALVHPPESQLWG